MEFPATGRPDADALMLLDEYRRTTRFVSEFTPLYAWYHEGAGELAVASERPGEGWYPVTAQRLPLSTDENQMYNSLRGTLRRTPYLKV